MLWTFTEVQEDVAPAAHTHTHTLKNTATAEQEREGKLDTGFFFKEKLNVRQTERA